ncbi:hypothetical protein HHI36_010156 [Cryptolaemus montrouzieri]|uniref:Transposase n=1 Tax=Cryptolaemus montrouzieri TaxID=559131 RepID=A0ABD2MI12_9CUCU
MGLSRLANSTKVVRARSTSNQMKASFFKKTRNVATIALEQRRTVNSEWYTTIYLLQVFDELRKSNLRNKIILDHENISLHTSAHTMVYLNTQNIELMSHPPYSPDCIFASSVQYTAFG